MLDLLSMGECMVELYCDGAISTSPHFYKSYGGDTLNTAVAAARLGSRAGFLSRIGDDPFAPFLLEEFRKERIDLTCCPVVKGFNGLYFISLNVRGEREFTYYRAGSAASTLRAEDLVGEYLRKTRLLHATGVSQGISPGCRAAVQSAFEIARREGVRTSYDPNYRANLWSRTEARDALEEILPFTEIFLPSAPEETRLLIGMSDPAEIGAWARERGAGVVVVKEGEAGCVVAGPDGERRIKNTRRIKVADTTGAGDAFNGSFLHGLLRGLQPDEAARLGVVAAGLKIEGRGAVRSLPTRDDVAAHVSDEPWAERALGSSARKWPVSAKTLAAFIDGGSRGNPGPAGAGVLFVLDGARLSGLYSYLGEATNNEAEYSALLRALEYACDAGFRRLVVYSDSELLVRQMTGQYKVKNARLKRLYEKACDQVAKLDHFSVRWVSRDRNEAADALANKAMDLRGSGEERYDAGPQEG